MQEQMAASGADLPVVVSIAGNDSLIFGEQDARYSSPFNNAAIQQGVANVIVVESVADSAASAGGATRSPFSNTNGHISAPGTDITSTVRPPALYGVKSGTSQAAPHVAGLIGYLYSADPNLPRPTLSQNTVLELLQANSVAVAGGAANRIDAYLAVLALDGDQLPTPSSAPVRHALMDANNDSTFDELDIEQFRVRFLDIATGQPLAAGAADWSRFDLNGDGRTGGPTTTRFDLDRVGSTQYGATSYTSGVTQSGLEASFDENAVTDLDILCYYAGSSLYQGSDENLESLLGEPCGFEDDEEEEDGGDPFIGTWAGTDRCQDLQDDPPVFGDPDPILIEIFRSGDELTVRYDVRPAGNARYELQVQVSGAGFSGGPNEAHPDVTISATLADNQLTGTLVDAEDAECEFTVECIDCISGSN